jgi:hypothetical protein
MKPLFTAALLAAAGAAWAASPYDEPYSIITIDEIRPADFHIKPVFVNRVDGENSVQFNKHVVAPGSHEVVIDLAPRGGFHLATQQVMMLRTEPCVRYNLAARVENSISQKWEPLVRSTEPITECQAKFKVARGD